LCCNGAMLARRPAHPLYAESTPTPLSRDCPIYVPWHITALSPQRQYQLGCRSSREAATIFTSTTPWAAAAIGQTERHTRLGRPERSPARGGSGACSISANTGGRAGRMRSWARQRRRDRFATKPVTISARPTPHGAAGFGQTERHTDSGAPTARRRGGRLPREPRAQLGGKAERSVASCARPRAPFRRVTAQPPNRAPHRTNRGACGQIGTSCYRFDSVVRIRDG